MTVANILTAARLLAVPLIVASAWARRPGLFLGLLVFALATDVVDGPIARRLGQASPGGARLDSIADAALYLSTPAAALLLYPALWSRERLAVMVVLAAYAIPIAVGFARFGRLTSYHTIAARVAASVLVAAFLVFIVTGRGWPLRVAAIVLVLSALEELALTFTLPAWRANVPSWWHVRRMRRHA